MFPQITEMRDLTNSIKPCWKENDLIVWKIFTTAIPCCTRYIIFQYFLLISGYTNEQIPEEPLEREEYCNEIALLSLVYRSSVSREHTRHQIGGCGAYSVTIY